MCLFGHAFLTARKPVGKSKSGYLFYTSEELENLWGLGNVSIQNLTTETASYCARYIMKKQLGPNATTTYTTTDPETGEVHNLEPPYVAMSLKPGIGETWYQQHNTDITNRDTAIIDGKKAPVPKYYDKLHKRHNALQLEQRKYERTIKAAKHANDQTPERLKTREAVHTAKVQTLTRN